MTTEITSTDDHIAPEYDASEWREFLSMSLTSEHGFLCITIDRHKENGMFRVDLPNGHVFYRRDASRAFDTARNYYFGMFQNVIANMEEPSK